MINTVKRKQDKISFGKVVHKTVSDAMFLVSLFTVAFSIYVLPMLEAMGYSEAKIGVSDVFQNNFARRGFRKLGLLQTSRMEAFHVFIMYSSYS